jgi:hypothetical protein
LKMVLNARRYWKQLRNQLKNVPGLKFRNKDN